MEARDVRFCLQTETPRSIKTEFCAIYHPARQHGQQMTLNGWNQNPMEVLHVPGTLFLGYLNISRKSLWIRCATEIRVHWLVFRACVPIRNYFTGSESSIFFEMSQQWCVLTLINLYLFLD